MGDFVFTVSSDHPSLVGHFPGNPIIPGVVILENTARGFEESTLGLRITVFKAVKFLAPLRPDISSNIEYRDTGCGTVKFTVRSDTELIASGTFIVASADTAEG